MMSAPSARKEALLAVRSLRTGAPGGDVLAAELACPRAAPAGTTHSFTMAGGMLDTGSVEVCAWRGGWGDGIVLSSHSLTLSFTLLWHSFTRSVQASSSHGHSASLAAASGCTAVASAAGTGTAWVQHGSSWSVAIVCARCHCGVSRHQNPL